MTNLHVAHALRMELPHGDEHDEYDEAFKLATRDHFQYELRQRALDAAGVKKYASVTTAYHTLGGLSVPREFLCYSSLPEAIENCSYIQDILALPDTLAFTFERCYYDNTEKEYHVDQSTIRCPLSLHVTLKGHPTKYRLIGALMASTDAKRQHRGYLRDGDDWFMATDGDEFMDLHMCPKVSMNTLKYILEGYATSNNGGKPEHEYPLRLWYRSETAMVCNNEAAEDRDMGAETDRILKNKHQAEQDAKELQYALAKQETQRAAELRQREEAKLHAKFAECKKAREQAEKELGQFQAEEKAAWARLVAEKAQTKSDKSARRAAHEARRLREFQEAHRRVRELNEQAAERRAAAAHAAAAAAKEHRERLARLRFRAQANPAFQMWERVSAPYRTQAKVWRELERQRLAAVLAAKREQAEQALIADTEERRLARLEREEQELAEWAGASEPKPKQRNKQPGLDRTAKTPEEKAKWEAERAAIVANNKAIHEERRLEGERKRAAAAATRVKFRPLMELKDWALDEPRGSSRPQDDDARSVCSVASSAITTTTTTSLPPPSKHARLRTRGHTRGDDRPVRKHHLQDAKKNGTTQRGANGNIVHRGRHATLVTDPTGQRTVTAWNEC